MIIDLAAINARAKDRFTRHEASMSITVEDRRTIQILLIIAVLAFVTGGIIGIDTGFEHGRRQGLNEGIIASCSLPPLHITCIGPDNKVWPARPDGICYVEDRR